MRFLKEKLMITVIAASNRKGNLSFHFAAYYFELLKSKTKEKVKLLDLKKLEGVVLQQEMYDEMHQSPVITKLQNEYMIPAERFVFVMPEYNGSFPGILKYFIDACSIRAYKPTFNNKKAALVGTSTGRAGNLRGMDHLNGILNHVGTSVFPNQLPISKIEDLLSEEGKVIDEETMKAIDLQMDDFLVF